MDQQAGHSPEDAADGAEQAFEALRAEVAALRRGIELLSRQGQQAAPDYSPTLGKMEKALGAIAGRLDAVERQPALRTTPADYRTEIEVLAHRAAAIASRPFAEAVQQTNAVTDDLKEVIGRAREQKAQRRLLAAAGVHGAIAGVLLWIMLIELLPSSMGDRLAVLPLGGSRWDAGLALMQRESPASFDKMIRLYNACPRNSTIEMCETAMEARTISPPASPSSAAEAGGTAAGAAQPTPDMTRTVPSSKSRPGNR